MKRNLVMLVAVVLIGCMAMPVLARGGGGGGGGRGGGGGGRGGGGGGRGGGGYGGYGGGYGRGFGYGGFGLGYGLGLGLGYGGYGGYGGGGYGDGGYGYIGPDYYTPSYSVPNYNVPNMPVPTATPDKAPIGLVIIVPDPQAQLWLNGTLTAEQGVDRVFVWPPTEINSSYSYDVRVTWNQGGQSMSADRHVKVFPGRNNIIDMRNNTSPTMTAPSN